MVTDQHLLVALTLPGRDKPIVCIPHGSGGTMGPRDLDRLLLRIERAAEWPDEPALMIHLTHHAAGSIATRVNLRDAIAARATAGQVERFEELSRADRIAAETRWADEGVLPLNEALALVAELGGQS